MPQVSFELIGDERLVRGVEALGSNEARVEFMEKSAALIEGKAKENASGRVLKVRSGIGRSRITRDTSGAPESFAVGSPDVYMRAHETGATIVARRVNLLTIPLRAAKTAAGVARFSARQAPYQDTFWRRSKKGKLILWGKNDHDKKPTPLFVGKESVVLPKRPWLRPAFDEGLDEMPLLLVQILERRLAQV